MKLVIVESPNKCETIQKYLGDGYKVIATVGHIRDLAICGKDGLGVDIENKFKPTYRIIKDKSPVVKKIIQEAKKAEEVLIATDPDREGEAIGAELYSVLNLDRNNKRLEFHEVTRDAIANALLNPRTIDFDLVASQEARRIIDRILGFRLSELLRKSVNQEAAGRVQSATLRFIIEHEDEIKSFVPKEYWSIKANLKNDNLLFEAPLCKYKDKEPEIHSKDEAEQVKADTTSSLKVTDISKKDKIVEPPLPFKTSTLQQEAINTFKYSSYKVAQTLQKLFTGVDINGEKVGLITYIRVDSTSLSETYVKRAEAYIKETFGEAAFVGPRNKKVKEGPVKDQLAHEAIRPTSNHRTPISVKPYLTPEEYNIYKLIYNRTLASLMANKVEEVTTILFGNDNVSYKISGSKTKVPGFSILYGGKDKELPSIPNVGDEFEVIDVNLEQKFTEPPARYNEAKVISLMEEKGIGRPSTYSSTINTLQKHKYLEKEKGRLIPTERGYKAIGFLKKNFNEFIQDSYTANLENQLDDVKEGETNREAVINGFYIPFTQKYDEFIDHLCGPCPKCGAKVTIKKYRGSYFLGCTRYPDCDWRGPIPTGEENKEKEEPEIVPDRVCPKCGSPLVYKYTKRNHTKFIGCSNFPKCKHVEGIKVNSNEQKEVGRTCPTCGSPLVEKTNKRGKKFIGCSNYPKCHYIEKKQAVVVKKCPDCDGNLVIRKRYDRATKSYKQFLGCTNFPKCKHIEEYAEQNTDKKD